MTGVSCFVVVRAAGERTETASARLATLQVGEENVAIIHEVPFSAAVRRGFEIGVAKGREWTLALDADVLLRERAVHDLCAAAGREWAKAPDLFEIEGRVADKLLGQLRPAGAHLYRTSLLPRALEIVEFDGKKRRPESRVKKRMREVGLRTVEIDDVLGLHDHEQYYRDIFRKVFTHTRKHERYMTYVERYWARMAATDLDLRIALWSCRLSCAINDFTDFSAMPVNERVAIDLRAFPDNLDAILKPAGMTEKPALPAEAIDFETVAARLATFETAAEFERDRPLVAARNHGRLARAKAYVAGYGLLGAVREYVGRSSLALGQRLTVKG